MRVSLAPSRNFLNDALVTRSPPVPWLISVGIPAEATLALVEGQTLHDELSLPPL
jgi:hypothetical protein